MTTDYTRSQRNRSLEVSESAMTEFLNNGGKVQQLAPGQSGVPVGGFQSQWGRPRKRSTDSIAESDLPESDLPESDLPESDLHE